MDDDKLRAALKTKLLGMVGGLIDEYSAYNIDYLVEELADAVQSVEKEPV